jgi:hypothetical protein
MISDEDDSDIENADLPDTEQQTFDVADPAALKKTRRAVAEYERQRREFWMAVFKSPVGRREMWDILNQCHFTDIEFGVGPNGFPQPEATWFKAGERQIGQRLFLTWTQIARADVFQMLDEHDPRYAKPDKKR